MLLWNLRILSCENSPLLLPFIQAQKNGNVDSGLCNVGSGEDVFLAIN